MTHFGIICPQLSGHLNVLLPLGKELQRRGHCVTFFGTIDAQSQIRGDGIEFQAIGESEFPLGTTAQSLVALGKLNRTRFQFSSKHYRTV
jgi:zeaxanthin glucosyltransferase